ncbi:MAG: carboxypeptidase regulatory-like domain-containing protein [Armatimonadetes bacterium]|nr:carboxypeptidase regulatory-like domain-containing protein [Armatimonadota bacterium]
MRNLIERILSLCALAFLLCMPRLASADVYLDWIDQNGWHDNYHVDTATESRRGNHMLMRFGNERVEGFLTEQLFQGQLQFCDNTQNTWLQLGFHDLGGYDPVNKYKGVLQPRRTWLYDADGNAVGFTVGPGCPGVHAPCSYFGYRDPNGVTPHEMGHRWGTTPDNTTGMPGFGIQGPGLSESFANFMEQLQLVGYPWDALVMGMPMGHAVGYYGNISIFTNFLETYGSTFFNNLAYAPNVANDDLIRKAIRVNPSLVADKAKDIYDSLGMMNARMLNMDFWNHRISEGRYVGYGNPSRFDDDTTRQGYFFYRIPMVQQPGVAGPWYRPEWTCTPQTLMNSYIPLTITSASSPRTVTCDFRPAPDGVRGTSFRVCFVAMNANREARYSRMWNAGVSSFTLADDEQVVYLAVMACPKNLNTTVFNSDFTSANVCMFPYRIKLTGADPKGWQWPAPTSGFSIHANGGGKKANTATVASTAYVGPNAMVLGTAKVYGNSRIEDYAVVDGSATIGRSGQTDNPVVSGHAYVTGTAQIYGHAKVRDYAWVWGDAKVYENAIVMAHTMLQNGATIFGSAVVSQAPIDRTGFAYNGSFSGSYIVGGDISGGGTYTSGVYCEFPTPPTTDNKYQYLGYNFEKAGSVYAMDQYGMNHGFLMNEPQVVGDTVNGVVTKVLNLDGVSQYVELKPDAVDFADITLSAWVKWAGSANDQIIFSTGDGNTKYMSLTPKSSATGFLRFAISDGISTQYIDGTSALPSTWTHIAITLSANIGTLYVNGLQVAQNTSLTIDPDQLYAALQADANFIGRNNSGNYFAGRIDEFRVYNKALISTEVTALQTDITAGAAPAADTTAPTPATSTWLVFPTLQSNNAITMSSTEGTDAGGNGVLYYFTCLEDSTHDSGWISESCYTDCNCAPGTTYTYTVKKKDRKGNTGASSVDAGVTTLAVDTTAPTPNPPTFSSAPKGTGTTSIAMTATKGVDDDETVMYKFTRVSTGATSGWTSSRTWTDTTVPSGSTCTYTLQMKDNHGNLTSTTTSAATLARDDTAPPMDPDFRMQFGTHPYVQLDKTVRMTCQYQAETNVQYYFECVEQPLVNSGWISHPSTEWITPAMADGTYNFRFKMRDLSPQQNVSAWSATKSATVTTTNSFQSYTLSQLAGLPDDTLVNFTGTVTQVYPTYYVVSDGTNTINVTPRATRSLTEPMMINKNVTVKGHLWTYTGTPKRVTFAIVRSAPAAGKIEFEDCETLNEFYTVEYDSNASHSEIVGGWAKQAGWEMSVPNVAAANQIVIGYKSYSAAAGTISMYVNGAHSANITLPLTTTYTSVKQTVSIPAGATLMFRADSGDISPALDYLILSNNTISGKVSNSGGTGISGATVYFSATPNAPTTYSITTTTDASGNYTQGMPNGTWYVAVSHPSYNVSADQTVTVNNASVSGVNFTMADNAVISGKVTNQSDGTAIVGATVFFTKSPTEAATYTATTNATGDYTQSLQNGVWYVCAAATGYKAAQNQMLTITGPNVTGINFPLTAFVRNIPRTSDLFFAVLAESLPASGPTGQWATYYPAGQSLTPYDGPTAITLNGVKWAVNSPSGANGGFKLGDYSTIPVNGISAVAVCQPKRLNNIGGYQSLLGILDQFQVNINRVSGELWVRTPGQGSSGVFIPDGQPTIVSVVVQPNGTFKAWANGDQVMNVTATNPFTTLGPSWNPEVWVGRAFIADGWSTFQGQIGDVFVYKVALTDAERQQLESDTGTRFGISLNSFTISASAGANGAISPSGPVSVPGGTNQTFIFTPNSGYRVSRVLVDGVSVGAAATYTFTNVTAAHTIAVEFITTDFIAFYKFDETTGTSVYDWSGNARNGTVTGTGWTAGLVNNCLRFATATYAQRVTMPTVTGSYTAFTMSMWVYPEDTATKYLYYNTGTGNGALRIQIAGTAAARTFNVNIAGNTTASQTTNPVAIPSNAWTLVTFGYDAAAKTCAYYVNGVLTQTLSYTTAVNPIFTGTTNYVGAQSTTASTAFVGRLDDFRLYSRALIGTEVTSLYDANSPTCAITASAGANGSISPNGAVAVTRGANQTFTITPNVGYAVASVLVDGIPQGAVGTYTFTNVTAIHTISATFTTMTYTITASAGTGGTITPSGAVVVNYGANQTFTISPSFGNDISQVTVDGVTQGPIASYTFNNTLANHTISATFATTITASADANGTISPTGAVIVTQGNNQTFTMTANSGYRVSRVLVDGVSVGAVTTYTFSNVIVAHTISAEFISTDFAAYWKFDETSGASAYDWSGNGKDGALTNGPTWTVGLINNAVNIPGGTSYVSVPSGIVLGLINFSISTWVKLTTVATNMRIFDFGTGATNYMELTPKHSDTNGALQYVIRTPGTVNTVSGATALPTGSWQHVAITRSGITNTLYRNGVQVGQITGTLSPNSLTSTTINRIGDSQTSTHPHLDGLLDDFRIYNKALTAAEIANLYNAGAPTWTITASAGAGGTISPLGTTTKNNGASQTYAITANSGYAIADVLIDGVSQGAVGTYTFSNITANHTISATFVKPLGVNNKAVKNDSKLQGKVVKVWGKVKSIGSGTFQISDGYSANVTIAGPTTGLNETKTVVVTGTVNADKSVTAQTIGM